VNSRKLILLILGVIFLLAGIVFSLQGADVITGSSLMSGNSTYIYVGAIVAIIGLALLLLSSRAGEKPSSPVAAGPP
jgi:protein-S-isoprenylcysteine O-methyltransferase Ste14